MLFTKKPKDHTEAGGRGQWVWALSHVGSRRRLQADEANECKMGNGCQATTRTHKGAQQEPKIKGDKHNSSKKAGDEQRPQRKGNERKWYERDNGMQKHIE